MNMFETTESDKNFSQILKWSKAVNTRELSFIIFKDLPKFSTTNANRMWKNNPRHTQSKQNFYILYEIQLFLLDF